MEIIARKSYQYLTAAIALALFGGAAVVYGALFLALEPEGATLSDSIILLVFGSAFLIASVPLLILNAKTPKIIAYFDGVFHFPDFECKSAGITDADFKHGRNKNGTLTVHTKEGARVYKNVKNVKFAYDKLAILILKSEGLLDD